MSGHRVGEVRRIGPERRWLADVDEQGEPTGTGRWVLQFAVEADCCGRTWSISVTTADGLPPVAHETVFSRAEQALGAQMAEAER